MYYHNYHNHNKTYPIKIRIILSIKWNYRACKKNVYNTINLNKYIIYERISRFLTLNIKKRERERDYYNVLYKKKTLI